MPPTSSTPDFYRTTPDAARQILSVYSTTLGAFYKDKVKGDDKKRGLAQEDDNWRYKEFPTEVQKRKAGQGITQEELERLVKWKITHQTNRPFLLPQIRKNGPEKVEQCTGEARAILSLAKTSSIERLLPYIPQDQIRKALDKVCELKGVGPATGTLILSVFDNENIPFFEDELYAWLNPGFSGKLKYNVKEYFEMLDKLKQVQVNGNEFAHPSHGTAEAHEKLAFVCEHWTYVDEEGKVKIQEALETGHKDQVEADREAGISVSSEESQATASSRITRASTALRKRGNAGDETQTFNPKQPKKKKLK